ncbi:ACT domain-containing protein [Desulfurivibrio alkaliphilus]|uniref:Amino acid-binding ACT domain protein n=1 Tax=Desulfurivibrio alkaliphilus (strain DSM 19089 / UNIQEM U267 / AHT2) TaxID=589865 RepID=D6Z5T7_DESAT|nr:ACT domain-containing protein [Desulfurivibrio alkaliphilus]ADH84819.1 amino acid-binding ACT domain protein [Desulfurivibrio alkaliphilus AHT 2]
MKIRQITIFLENKSGRLADITATLAKHGINIRALSLADTADFGILRLVVSDTDQAAKALKEDNFTVGITEVVAVAVPDQPGSLDSILKVVQQAQLNVEYMYAFTQHSGETGLLLFRFDDPDKACRVLQENGCKLLSDEEVHKL